MATSSILHNFVISDQETVHNFIKAIEDSEKSPFHFRENIGREVTDPYEILNIIEKRKRPHA